MKTRITNLLISSIVAAALIIGTILIAMHSAPSAYAQKSDSQSQYGGKGVSHPKNYTWE